MKKAFLAMAAVAMALTSCNNELNEVVEEAQPIKLNINFEKANDGDTRAVKAEFAVDDNVVLMGSSDSGLYDIMVFKKTAEGWKLDESHLEKNSNIHSVSDLGENTSWKWVAIWSENMTIPSAKEYGVWSLWAGTENYKGETIISEGQTLTVKDGAITTKFTLKQPADFVKITLTDLDADKGYKLGIFGTQSYKGSIINNKGTVDWGSNQTFSGSVNYKNATPGYASDGGAAFFLQKSKDVYTGTDAQKVFYVFDSNGNHCWKKTFTKALTDDAGDGKTYFGNAIKTAGPITSNTTVNTTDANGWECTK